MSEFNVYFLLGLEHILDANGIDHILFVIALSVNYPVSEWRKLLILITAFTLGHSLTLALSSLSVLEIDAALIELLIPVTILITSISNIFIKRDEDKEKVKLNYFYASFFGLIHGLGFSNYFKNLVGKNVAIIKQLFAFNLGLELGQIIIIILFFTTGFLFLNVLKSNKRGWTIVVSALIAFKALHLIFKNLELI